MRRNSQEFVNFIARHYHVVEALCQRHPRFTSDDEIIAFLAPFETEDKNLTRLIGRMREVGVLIDLAGEWCVPPFLVGFIQELAARHVLASPKVIQGWVATLERHVEGLLAITSTASLDLGASNNEDARELLLEIADVFQTIVRTVQDNCERIASEVSDYRATEDASRLRSRLARLIKLHDEYLEPIIQIIDIGGEFFSVTEKVATCCTRLAVHNDGQDIRLADEARSIRQDVTWLRRAVVRRAEEARRELAPLCEAAARESMISRGVTRSLDAISHGLWQNLTLEENLRIIVEHDATTFSDVAIERYLRLALKTATQTPPKVPAATPDSLSMPVTPDELLEKLEITESIDDLLDWVLETCEEIEIGDAVRLFHSIVELRPERTRHTASRRDYSRGDLIVDAATWTWKGPSDGHFDAGTDNGRPSRKARKRVSTA